MSNKTPQRVLQVTSKLFQGGAESFIMNLYRNIDRSRIQFDFLVFHDGKEYYESEIHDLGGSVFRLSVMDSHRFFEFPKQLDRLFAAHKGEYVAIHGHMASLGNYYLGAASRAGISLRIAHSHTANYDKNARGLAKYFFERLYAKHATHLLACSDAAGAYMFGQRSFEKINNGINIGAYSFSFSKRLAIRKALGLGEDNFVVGHVGRFVSSKNHDFLIDIFRELTLLHPSSKLLLAGDGELRSVVEKKVLDCGLDKNVLFLGSRDDMPDIYCGMDVLVMPSLYEGFPFSVIEAQCEGLPCLLSNTISKEVGIFAKVHFLSLSDSSKRWAQLTNDLFACCDLSERRKAPRLVKNAGYDIKEIATSIEALYEGGYNR